MGRGARRVVWGCWGEGRDMRGRGGGVGMMADVGESMCVEGYDRCRYGDG